MIDKFLTRLFPHYTRVWCVIGISISTIILTLKGHFVGLALAILGGISTVIMATSPTFSRRKSQRFGTSQWVNSIGIIIPIVMYWGAFFALNALPLIGDMGFKDYRGFLSASIVVIGFGYLMATEIDRPSKYLLPMVTLSALSLVGYSVFALKYDYVFQIFELIFLAILFWDLWFSAQMEMQGLSKSSMGLLLPISVFFFGYYGFQNFLHAWFPSGLLIQFFFSIPGLLGGMFVSTYLNKFRFRKSSWITISIIPIVIGLIFGVEASICYWITFGFGCYLNSILDHSRVFYFSAASLATSVVMTVCVPIVHIPFAFLGTELRSVIAVSVVVFWLILTLFSTQSRRDWSIEHLSRTRLRKRRVNG